ncbi:uncharacterized protein [Diadema setosum]|uniref:uncharacterized protein isoform X2 n=1 Tax=Diadema setosum TaxID=31175 RepID=UPI003B3B508F
MFKMATEHCTEGMNSPVKEEDTGRECTPPRLHKKQRLCRKPTHKATCPVNPSRRLVFSSQEGNVPGRKRKRKVKHRRKGRSIKQDFQTRSIDILGTWVQCNNTDCMKWRYLSDVSDPSLVPDVWTCEMNSDTSHNSCMLPEEDYSSLEFVHAKYTEGSIVWAKMQGYPWWPAMVEEDPDTELFLYRDPISDYVTDYHVVFLDKRVTRMWVKLANIQKYDGGECPGPMTIKGHNYSQKILEAKAVADEALKMPIEERIKNFGFGATFRGHWGEYDTSDGSQEQAPRKVKIQRPKEHGPVTKKKLQEESMLSHTEMEEILDEAEAMLGAVQDFVTEAEDEVQGKLLEEMQADLRKSPEKKRIIQIEDKDLPPRKKKRGRPKKEETAGGDSSSRKLTKDSKESAKAIKEQRKQEVLQKKMEIKKAKEELKALKATEKKEKKERKLKERRDKKEKEHQERKNQRKKGKLEEKTRKEEEKKLKPDAKDNQSHVDDEILLRQQKRQQKRELKKLKKELKKKKKDEKERKEHKICSGGNPSKKEGKKPQAGTGGGKMKPNFQNRKKAFSAPVQRPPEHRKSTPGEESSVIEEMRALIIEIVRDKDEVPTCEELLHSSATPTPLDSDGDAVKSAALGQPVKKSAKPKFSVKTKDGHMLGEPRVALNSPQSIPLDQKKAENFQESNERQSIDSGEILEVSGILGEGKANVQENDVNRDSHTTDTDAFPLSQMTGNQLEPLLNVLPCTGNQPKNLTKDENECRFQDKLPMDSSTADIVLKKNEELEIQEFSPDPMELPEPDEPQRVPGPVLISTSVDSMGEDSDPFEFEE